MTSNVSNSFYLFLILSLDLNIPNLKSSVIIFFIKGIKTVFFKISLNSKNVCFLVVLKKLRFQIKCLIKQKKKYQVLYMI